MSLDSLISWEYSTLYGFSLRGMHSPPSGKPLLHFLHGNSFCGMVYAPMLERLSAHFDLWLCDVQGHGDSDLGGAFKGWNTNASLAVQAFEHHLPLFGDVTRHALGHSFGGVLTALILGKHHHLFQRAVLLDPVIFPPAMAATGQMAQAVGLTRFAPLARAAKRRRSHWPSREAALDSLRGRGTYKGWTEEALQAFGQYALRDADHGNGVILKCPPSREAEIFASVPTGLWSKLRRIVTPTLVVHASRTYPFIQPSVAMWTQMNHHVSSVETPGGHCFMQCDPEAASCQIESFLLRRSSLNAPSLA